MERVLDWNISDRNYTPFNDSEIEEGSRNLTKLYQMPEKLKAVNDIVVPSILIVMILCMACGVSISEAKRVIKKPFPAVIGK